MSQSKPGRNITKRININETTSSQPSKNGNDYWSFSDKETFNEKDLKLKKFLRFLSNPIQRSFSVSLFSANFSILLVALLNRRLNNLQQPKFTFSDFQAGHTVTAAKRVAFMVFLRQIQSWMIT